MEGFQKFEAETVEQQEELFFAVKRREWLEVVEIFKKHPEIQGSRINLDGETALHVAISHGASEDVVAEMIHAIEKTTNAIETLSASDKDGSTLLHCAASRGSTSMCYCIKKVNPSLLEMRNMEGETPLFVAALNGHKEAFHYLYAVCKDMNDISSYWRRTNGDTILHCALEKKHIELSFQILHLCDGIAASVNQEKTTPLDILASTPSAFRSGTRLNWWEKFCYHFIPVDEQKFLPPIMTDIIVEVDSVKDLKVQQKDASTRFLSTLGLVSVREKKERHILGAQILEELVRHDFPFESDHLRLELFNLMHTDMHIHLEGEREKKSSALLTAAKYGLIEPVIRILSEKEWAFHDRTRDNKNIVHVAVEERHIHILMELKKYHFWNDLKVADCDGKNNALHLVAKPPKYPWQIPTSGLTIQQEFKWFEYVSENLPAHFVYQPNIDGETPLTIFAKAHESLYSKTNKWVNEASGNFIVATTLISGATFATCFQIPGGYEGHDATPMAASHSAFQVFAMAVLVSFFFSITSLAAFLALYASRKGPVQDYTRNLPLKLCIGLSSLFVSIVSMLISFCAAHSFELQPRNKYKPFPLYSTLIFIPVCFYAATQIPLYWDLLKASLTREPLPGPMYPDELQDHIRE